MNVKMSTTPFVSVCTGEDGEKYVLLRQSATDGQYSVDICLSIEQFSNIMAILRGLEMYFMDMELRKPVNSLPSTDMEMNLSCSEEPSLIAEDALVNIGTQTIQSNARNKSRKRKSSDTAENI